jgi:hypothetical protein
MSSQTTEGFIKTPVQPVRMECGPTLGKPSSRSLDFFYLCSYDVDRLREFLKSPGFSETYDTDEPFMEQLLNDEVTLMKLGFRILKQVLFGEATIPLKPDALEKRISRRRTAQPGIAAEQPIS